jgi:hypothetical protein
VAQKPNTMAVMLDGDKPGTTEDVMLSEITSREPTMLIHTSYRIQTRHPLKGGRGFNIS